jgi:hypothetical protein
MDSCHHSLCLAITPELKDEGNTRVNSKDEPVFRMDCADKTKILILVVPKFSVACIIVHISVDWNSIDDTLPQEEGYGNKASKGK